MRRGPSGVAVAVGAALGAVSAVALTSDGMRRSRAYWFVTDYVGNPFIRSLEPESAHTLAVASLRAKVGPLGPKPSAQEVAVMGTRVWGRELPHPVGMPSGFDKQATIFEDVLGMGFSFVEVGGVTPRPQPGNPKPRMWRLLEDRGIINRFGLNSDGHDAVAARLATRDRVRHPGLVGVNLAKNTDSADLVGDYVAGVRKLGPLVDFIVLNVSCPNVGWTKDLMAAGAGAGAGAGARGKEEDGGVRALVEAVRKERDATCPEVPLLLKVGPDMDEGAMRKMATITVECGVDGLVVSNTTTSRDASLRSENKQMQGGLSGEPLKARAVATTKRMYALTGGAVPIIGVGGIMSAEDAYERIRAGATLVQIYTGMVYEGPGLVNTIREGLPELLKRDGFKHVSQAVGVDVKEVARERGGA